MKFLITPLFLCFVVTASAQQYGAPVTDGLAIEATDIEPGMEDEAANVLKIKGTILEVCQVRAAGCPWTWVKATI